MKTALVKYLLDQQNKVVKRFLVEDEVDIQKLHDNKIIGVLHKEGLRKIINNGDKAIVNDMGGYCNTKGTWEIIKPI